MYLTNLNKKLFILRVCGGYVLVLCAQFHELNDTEIVERSRGVCDIADIISAWSLLNLNFQTKLYSIQRLNQWETKLYPIQRILKILESFYSLVPGT